MFEPTMEVMGAVERSMMEYSFPTADGMIFNIAKPAVEANNFEIKPAIIQIIRSSVQFSSFPDEDPNKYLINFLEICDTFRFNGVSNDAVRLRIFPFSLCDTAKAWLQSLPAGSITTWAVLTQKFLAKYMPPAKTAKMLNDITFFVQLDSESLYDAWERFKSMLRKCPHHELPVWQQVQIFYNGVILANRATIDAAAGGTIMKKLPSEAFNIIDEIATNLYSYGQERADKRTTDIHNIDAVSALFAQMIALTHKVDNLGAAMWNGAPIGPCGACGQMGHWSQDCKSLWDELDRKYNTEEQGLKKYFVSKFMRYQMVEDRSIAEQTHEIINLEHVLADAEMKLLEKFLVMSIMDKLPKSCIEEEHRNQTHKMPIKHQPRANLIVGKQKVNKVNSNSKVINKGKATKNKKPKANKPCWNYGQVGHWAKLCPDKKAKTGQATVNMVVEGSNGASTLYIGRLITSTSPRVLRMDLLVVEKVAQKRATEGKLSLKYFQVWGFLAKVLVPEYKRKKLGPKTVDAVFLGYVETSYALRFLTIKSEISGIEFCDAVFIEDVFPMKTGIPSSVSLDDSLASTSIPEYVKKMTNVGVNPSSTSLTHEESDEPRRSKRARVVKNFGSDFVTYNIKDGSVTFKDAMTSSKAKQWKEAKKLVAKGFKQKEGTDYFDTYSPVAQLTTIRVLIALALVYSLPIHQMDVKIAFLYGELKEEIYMDQPEGFVHHGNERKVCKLVKSLYGLKQASK
ncbi:UNVERIFIED_CONTAM: Retrovirus-related Pol polyprotein from transposon TNT 1-94 [Sesamum latifolium]|uniref:Retrovirus-related Pol polyprotein from transposon TNT 1-94 n=1 Tax=Sesamum latifolium TaxID=2727402 RepID=A0AAW2WYE2_9LAMI